ncbi:uncharacterized protein [Drosophila tropicalis]|uniref:uncharacterized protein n=1 Tax=Drosophila tropicalis TaxID=46794 RepID=UPI0035AC0E41
MSGVGQLEPFDLNHPNKWTTYKQRFELYLLANDVTEEARKKAALLTLAGAPLFELLTSLASPTQVSDLSLSEIYEILNQHLSPCQSEIAAYYQFHKRDQLIDESVANYMAALRTLAVDCKFGAALDRMLRDRFVCGMKDEGLQKSLLAEADLTIQRAMERATSSEAAAHSAWAMRNTAESTESIHEVQTNAIRPSRPNQHHQPCDGCGGAHLRKLCPHRNTVCHACHRAGHLQRVCRAVRDPGRKAFNTSSGHDSYRGPHKQKPNEEYSVHSILPLICPKEIVTIIINKRKCQFEVDSGSAITMIDEATFRYIWPTDRPNIQDCALEFTDYQKNRIPVIGIVDTSVQYDNKYIPNLPLVVTSSGGSNLLGRNWFMPLGISIEGIHAINAKLSIEATLAKYKDLFSSELGRFRGPPVSLQINTDATPVRLPARRIPFAIQELYEEELDRLCSQGILVPIEYSDWATPTVPVIKKDGTIRICGDYKSTINKVIKQHGYQIPPMNSLLASVEGGSIFAKIDLAQAYQQLVVDEQSALMQTICTHKGYFKVTRLQFGISSAPGIFQSCIERILQNVSGVLPYFDDIIVMGKSEEELAVRLNEVLSRFDKAGLRLRRDKCQFGVPSVEFLGFKIDALGIRPCASKVEAIKCAPAPKDKKQLQAFLGLINFYHAFLPHKATVAEPLHRLLDKNAPWVWAHKHQDAFMNLKNLVTSQNVLMHFDGKLPVLLTCDASPYGIGAVLSHKLQDGSEKPIAFYSRTLSKTERNYSQIDREAVGLISGVKKFHNYLYGRSFTLVTDHRPLLGIFTTAKATPNVISTQMLRRAIFLNAYDFTLIHRPGSKMGNADFLSRCPLPQQGEGNTTEEVLMIEWAGTPLVSAQSLALQTKKDAHLSKVLTWVLRGWPNGKVDRSDQLYSYFLADMSFQQTKEFLYGATGL